ncbi:MAG: hypothetical protein ABI351_03050 [Herbaspirillum sp.]
MPIKPYHLSPSTPAHTASHHGSGYNAIRDITEFLGADDKFGALLPAITRMAALQNACAQHLPPLFADCDVIQFASNQLILAVATPALATKLKHQLPKLQQTLCGEGWQIDQIRIMVQIKSTHQTAPAVKQLVLAPTAVPALTALMTELDDVPRNATLRNALATMLRRHQQT